MRFNFHVGSRSRLRSNARVQPYQSYFISDQDDGTAVINHLAVDMHGHWLPGVDDGAQNTDDALTLVKGLSELGYRKLIATPHIMHDYYQNKPHLLIEVFEEFLRDVLLAGIDIELSLAAEYMLDEGFFGHLERGNLLMLPRKMVLIEMPLLQPFPGLHEILFEMQLQGYQPVLAHPERYTYLHKDLNKYEDIKEAGCLFQLNMLSKLGYYGKNTASIATELQERNWYELVGSDLHNVEQMELLPQVEIEGHYLNHTLIKNTSASIPSSFAFG